MRSVDEQLARILAAAVRPAPVRVAISEAGGLRCAEEVLAPRPLPGFDQAAVDGYAVRSVDLAGASDVDPAVLPVVGEVPAGSRQPHRLQPGQAVQVATGAPLPTLADAVVPLAFTDEGSAKLSVHRVVPSAGWVRRIGEDVQPGDVVVRRDSVIDAVQVGLLAAAGRDKVLVYPRPRVSVLSVGDELVELGRTPGPGQVADVCAHALSAAAREAGAETARAAVVGGEARAAAAAIADRLPFSDVLIVCGAAGGRAAAQVQAGLANLGGLDATRVAMDPGSCQGFGRLGPDGVPTFLFPNHPATALLLFEVLVRPLLRTALGLPVQRRTMTAQLLTPVTSLPGRRSYLWGRLLREQNSGEFLAQPLVTSGGQLFSTLTEANALIVLPEDVVEAGLDERVSVTFLPGPR